VALAISPEDGDDEAGGRVREVAVFFPMVHLDGAEGIVEDAASEWVALGEPWFYQRLGG
jgi:hypothetical protein